jgi:hypothetical protein
MIVGSCAVPHCCRPFPYRADYIYMYVCCLYVRLLSFRHCCLVSDFTGFRRLPVLLRASLLPRSSRSVLATGCLDGTILLWNMDTRGLARVHEPHNCIPTGCAEARTENIPDVAVDAPAAKVTALGWAHNGHAFATGSGGLSVSF